MENKYQGLDPAEGFMLFERNIIAATGISDEALSTTLTELDAVGMRVAPYAHKSYKLGEEARLTVWENARYTTQAILLVGALARAGWHRRTPLQRDILYFKEPRELRPLLNEHVVVNLAATALESTNYEHQEVAYIPREMVPWNSVIYRQLDSPSRYAILSSLHDVRFAAGPIDSEDSDDPHPVERYVTDETLPLEYRRHLLDEASRELTLPNIHKVHIWKMLLSNTLRTLAASPHNELRFQARQSYGYPESDTDYKEFIRTEQRASQETWSTTKQLNAIKRAKELSEMKDTVNEAMKKPQTGR